MGKRQSYRLVNDIFHANFSFPTAANSKQHAKWFYYEAGELKLPFRALFGTINKAKVKKLRLMLLELVWK